MCSDQMLDILYDWAFQAKKSAERLSRDSDKIENADRLKQVEYAKHKLLTELISIRTEQLRK